MLSLRNLTGENAEDLYACINKQKQIYQSGKENFLALTAKLKAEIALLLKSVSSVKNTYLALGGKSQIDKQKLIDCIVYSGSVYKAFNGITLLKESGILD